MSTVTSWIPVDALWKKFDYKPLTGELIVKRTGSWPEPTVDHINRDPWDNRFWNLRAATEAEQARNTKAFQGGADQPWNVCDQG